MPLRGTPRRAVQEEAGARFVPRAGLKESLFRSLAMEVLFPALLAAPSPEPVYSCPQRQPRASL